MEGDFRHFERVFISWKGDSGAKRGILGTEKCVSEVLCIYPKDIFPKGEFPCDNVFSIFLDVQFLKRQLPKFRPVRPFTAPQAAMRGGAAARTAL